MKKLLYPACFYPCEDKPGAYTVVVPDLPGCISEGDSLEDAIAMATDAASGWVLDEIEEGRPVPAASDRSTIHPDSPDRFVTIFVLDMIAYEDRHGIKGVRKNLTIPAWLNTFAETNHVNFSQVLQDALISMYQRQMAKR